MLIISFSRNNSNLLLQQYLIKKNNLFLTVICCFYSFVGFQTDLYYVRKIWYLTWYFVHSFVLQMCHVIKRKKIIIFVCFSCDKRVFNLQFWLTSIYSILLYQKNDDLFYCKYWLQHNKNNKLFFNMLKMTDSRYCYYKFI